ncbi:hypothetical protein ACM66B_000104 [Microbotryomycetes sp. NB124-2]
MLVLVVVLLLPTVYGHMSMWHPSMLAFDGPQGCSGDDCLSLPVVPVGPDWKLDDWWFRGPAYRAAKPNATAVATLLAGAAWTVDITCHKAFSKYGYDTSDPKEALSACPNGPGPYHADLDGNSLDKSLVAGCALGIADVSNFDDVTMENMVIFSTQSKCVEKRETSFEIPEEMPVCTGEHCICAWFWLPHTGQGNFYMTAFQCNVSRENATLKPARQLATPQAPRSCVDATDKCVKGAKNPIYFYNEPSNVEWHSNENRPAYNSKWSFNIDGAQTDIFLGEEENSSTDESPFSVVDSTRSIQETTSTSNSVRSQHTVSSSRVHSSGPSQWTTTSLDSSRFTPLSSATPTTRSGVSQSTTSSSQAARSTTLTAKVPTRSQPASVELILSNVRELLAYIVSVKQLAR